MLEIWTIPHLASLQHQLVSVALVIWVLAAIWRARSYQVWWPHVSVLLAAMLGLGIVLARLQSAWVGDVTGAWWNPMSAGYSSFGLFAGAGLALLAVSRAVDVSFAKLIDVILPGSLGALAVVRLGCLFRGCDFGGPAEWGVRHAAESPVALVHPSAGIFETGVSAVVHPLPVYLSLAALLGAIVALMVSRSSAAGRSLIGAIVYLVLRAFLEPLRSPESVWPWLGINANVVLSLVAALLCVMLLRGLEKHADGLPGK